MSCRCGASGSSSSAWPACRTEPGAADRRLLSPQIRAEVIRLACERPIDCMVPLTRWSSAELAREAVTRGICEQISGITVWRWLSEDAIKPWQYRSWIFPRDPHFTTKAGRILDLYAGRWEGELLHPGDYVVCCDEKPSIQARHRTHRTLPATPSITHGQRVEHEYDRRGAGELRALPAADLDGDPGEQLALRGGGFDVDHRRLLDLVVVAPHRLAVRAQDIELVRSLVAADEDVAGVGVLTVRRAIPPASASRARRPSVGASSGRPPFQVKSAMWKPRSIGTDDPTPTCSGIDGRRHLTNHYWTFTAPVTPAVERSLRPGDAGTIISWHGTRAWGGEHRDLVFCHPETGKPLDRSKLVRRFKQALDRADIHRITFHELRQTFGTRMAASGTPMRTLQHWMGHTDSKTTQIYAHYQPSDQEADAVDQAFA